DFVEMPVLGLLDDSYLRSRSRQISTSSTMGKALPGQPPGSVSGRRLSDNREGFPSTSHLSVVDNQGNSVSLTMSIERAFGSHLFVRGFLLNNQLTDFAHLPQSIKQPMANAIAPGKRPRSSMSPMLIFDQDGKLFATIGSPGGSRIIAYVVKAIVGLIDWNLDMQSAIDLPNHVNRNGATELEKDTEVTKRAYALRQLKHEVRIRVLNSGLQGIRITPQGFDGGADSRREGIAIGD
ncbi:MAG: gamma-glutamyltransferase, partial [Pseudomonadota bacterium]|nr:gamma-glutamyltransferase [Pseudomonadota bacterium]